MADLILKEPARLRDAWDLTRAEEKVMAIFRTGTQAQLPEIAEAVGMTFEKLQKTMEELERRRLLSRSRTLTSRYLAASSDDEAIVYAREALHSALPVAVDTLTTAAREGDTRAAESILDRTMGKPIQQTVTLDVTPNRQIREMTEDEIAQALAGHPLVIDVKTGDAEV